MPRNHASGIAKADAYTGLASTWQEVVVDIREDPHAVVDERIQALGPHPVQRALVALLLGVALGVVAALVQPRRRDISD